MPTGAAALLAALLAFSGLEQTLRVVPLPRDGEVLVSFQLAQTLTPELRTAIASGLTISFVYKVDLRRSSAIWVDRTIASSVVTATIKYDNLTRRYHLTRMLDGSTDIAETTDREEAACGLGHATVRTHPPLPPCSARIERRVLRARASAHLSTQRLVRLAVAG